MLQTRVLLAEGAEMSVSDREKNVERVLTLKTGVLVLWWSVMTGSRV